MTKKVREYSLDELIEMRKQGVTLRKIGELLHISYQRAQQILGPTRSIIPRKKKLTPEERTARRLKKRTEKFWASVDVSEPDKCWEWRGSINRTTGYGHISFNGKSMGVHRVAYELANGPIPVGKCVLHNCDNALCCNPEHLRAGTQLENAQDRDSRGRRKSKSGDLAYYRQRNQTIVDRFTGDSHEIKPLADEFGVSRQMIYTVILRARHGQTEQSEPGRDK